MFLHKKIKYCPAFCKWLEKNWVYDKRKRILMTNLRNDKSLLSKTKSKEFFGTLDQQQSSSGSPIHTQKQVFYSSCLVFS